MPLLRGVCNPLKGVRAPSILRLALPAPVEAILAGRTDQPLMLEQLERPLPASWEQQRRLVSTAAI